MEFYNKNLINNVFAGGLAGIINMALLHSPKTIIKYQYVYNTSIIETYKQLVKHNNDKLRIFRGILPSIMKSSLGKMGDIGIYTYYMDKNEYINKNDSIINEPWYNQNINMLKISFLTTLWRFNLIPIDTLSNTYQVHGKEAYNILKNKVKKNNIHVLYHGSIALTSINFISNFIWFSVFTNLNKNLPNNINNDFRNGLIGFSSTLSCDIVVNPIRIIKTYKQSHKENISYINCINEIFSNKNNIKNQNSISTLFRGFKIRIMINSISSGLYVILWKRIENTLS